MPKMGVYATDVRVDVRKFRAVTNVGMRPTFDGKALTVESYLFDFDESMTGGAMEVRFWARLRDEMKFSGPEALRGQIFLDIARGRRFFRLADRVTIIGGSAGGGRLCVVRRLRKEIFSVGGSSGVMGNRRA